MYKFLSQKSTKKLTVIPEINEASHYTSRNETLLCSGIKNSVAEINPNKLFLRPFGKFSRKLIFFLLFYINIVINIDHGIIPAGIKVMTEDLDLDEVHIGLLGSFVFLGLTLGTHIYKKH